LKEKESYRWVKTLSESTVDLPAGIRAVTVCDREGDMYELFDAAEQGGQTFLIRTAQNRMTVDNGRILNEIRQKPCAGRVKTIVPRDSRRNLKERKTVLEIRYGRFEIRRPAILNKVNGLNYSHEATVIHAREETDGKSIEPVEWFLMTNEAAADCEAAYEYVG
jgi:hypothetical protein